jgi:hypothetical protein
MKTITLSYQDISADELRMILVCGDIWFKRTVRNTSAFQVIRENGDEVHRLLGDVSYLGNESDFESALEEIFDHYRAGSGDFAFSGDWQLIKIRGIDFDRIRKAIENRKGILVTGHGTEVWLTKLLPAN